MLHFIWKESDLQIFIILERKTDLENIFNMCNKSYIILVPWFKAMKTKTDFQRFDLLSRLLVTIYLG